jgi:hypothetical protein
MSKSVIGKIGSGLLVTLAGLLFASSASAVGTVSQVTCSEIEFNKEIIHYPDISNACLGIIDYEGEQYAKLQSKVIRTGMNNLVLRYMHSDGNYGPEYRTTDLPSEFRVVLDGKKTRISELSKGQILNFYVKIGAEMATMMEAEPTVTAAADEASSEPVVEAAPEPVQVTMVAAPAMLPKTAGWFYEILLAGLTLLAIAGGLTFSRVKSA